MSVSAGSLAHRPLAELLEAIGGRTPAPGGGSSVAWAGALAAGLVEMTARFARGGAEAPDEPVGRVLARAQVLRDELLVLADRDALAFAPVLDALALPEDDPRRAERVRETLSAAAQSPLEIARACAELAGLALEARAAGGPHLIGDATAGALIAAASARAAARLVEINLAGRDDDPRLAEARALARQAQAVE